MAEVQYESTPPDRAASGEQPVHEIAARIPGMYARERVLIACAALLIALFAFTAIVARQYHRTVHRLGDQWFGKGEASMQAGRTSQAVTEYRNALVYKPDDETFEFHLALALASAGREDEARSYLQTLLADSPGSGPINLALARVAVNLNRNSDAIRYYHNAIYGVWDADPLDRRWQVRRELCEYLINERDLRDAEPDLIALAQETPPGDTVRGNIAGSLLLRAGLWSRSLDAFRSVLAVQRRDPDALAGAGRAAFHLAMYSDVTEYFQRLPSAQREAPDVADIFALSQEAATMNALRPGLRASEEAKRAAKALSVALSRISSCAKTRGESLVARTPTSNLQKLYATARQNRRTWSEPNLARHSDLVVSVMTFAAKAETAAAAECGPPSSVTDRALSLVASNAARTLSD
jgi:tetratricopeptide (TPR) repeat protein